MTREERNNKLKYLITCMKCEVSGKCCDENCPIQYDAGNMGEIIENLEEISKILEREPRKGYWIEGQTDNPKIHNILCSCCFEGYPSKGHSNSQYTKKKFQYCPNCGARMVEPQESEDKE